MFNTDPSLVATEHLSIQKGLNLVLMDNSSPSVIFNLKEHAESDSHEVKQFIRERFLKGHGANINHFMPRTFSLSTSQNELIAAFGLRQASNTSLFLESYLHAPIEKVLETDFNILAKRNCIVEVGNLSATHPGAARLLIIAITSLLYKESYEWVAFTSTSTIRNVFYRLGLEPIELCDAKLEQLPLEEQANWGRYYDNLPTVMVGNIEQGYSALQAQMCLAQKPIKPIGSRNVVGYL